MTSAPEGARSDDPIVDPLLRALRPRLCPESAPTGVLLAVSGGPDSTALMHAAALCARVPLHVATVDHGFRPDSVAEARAVAEAAARLGLPHHLLTREGEKPASRLQAVAREARYGLLAACADRLGIGLVLTAHTLDDQAETVLLRLCAGSGPAGLAGMAAERPLRPALRLARPFLGLAKAELIAWCEARGIGFVADPSNADERFARARLRRAMPHLAAEGLSAARLARLAERLARDEAALEAAAARSFAALRLPAEEGALRLDGALAGEPDAIALRSLALALALAGAQGPERLERLERLAFGTILPALREGRAVRRTLRGLTIETTRSGTLLLRPAPARRAGAAGAPELLGKGSATAYIGDERGLEHPGSGRAPALSRD